MSHTCVVSPDPVELLRVVHHRQVGALVHALAEEQVVAAIERVAPYDPPVAVPLVGVAPWRVGAVEGLPASGLAESAPGAPVDAVGLVARYELDGM